MIRRIAAAALCVGILGGGAATADAAVKIKPGVFKGFTEQDAKVSLKVLSSRKAVVKFSWEGVAMGCTDGVDRQLPGFTSPSSERFALSRKGKFKINVTTTDGAVEFAAVGTVKGGLANGGLQVQARLNEQSQVDPNGSIVCDSEVVGWVANR
jgi:hypothetical protein